jgi:hypothetical protein
MRIAPAGLIKSMEDVTGLLAIVREILFCVFIRGNVLLFALIERKMCLRVFMRRGMASSAFDHEKDFLEFFFLSFNLIFLDL